MQDNSTAVGKKVNVDIDGDQYGKYWSVPRDFIRAWNKSPAMSFDLLPIVNTGNRDNGEPYGDYYGNKNRLSLMADYTLAPVVLVDGDVWGKEWETVRCPVCAGKHRFGADLYRENPRTITWSSVAGVEGFAPMLPREQFLGQHKSHKCHEDRYDDGRWIWLVGIDREPTKQDLDKYFPTKVKPVKVKPVDRSAPQKTQGGVYFIKAANRFKIGISGNPSSRISSIATASPYPIETIHIEYTDDYQRREKRLHERFSGFRTHLEWFEFSDDMIPEVIAEMKIA